MQELRRFFKANPQALVLLIICLVLGLGTFLAVVFGVVTSKNPTTPSGEPDGALPPRVTLVAHAYGNGRAGPRGDGRAGRVRDGRIGAATS